MGLVEKIIAGSVGVLISVIFTILLRQLQSLKKDFQDGLKDIVDNHLNSIYEKLEQHSREISELNGFIRGILRRNSNENSGGFRYSK